MACTVAVGGDIFPPLEFYSSFVFLKILVAKKREISFPCPGGGPGDEALRRPGDRDGGEQPQAGREPDRGDQE